MHDRTAPGPRGDHRRLWPGPARTRRCARVPVDAGGAGRGHGPRPGRHAAHRPGPVRLGRVQAQPVPLLPNPPGPLSGVPRRAAQLLLGDEVRGHRGLLPRRGGVQHDSQRILERRAGQHPARAERCRAPPSPQHLRPPPCRGRAHEAPARAPTPRGRDGRVVVRRGRRCCRARSRDRPLHDRVRAGLRQRVPHPSRVPGAGLPRRGARPVLLLVPLDDEWHRRPSRP